jgi:hypothetical protein
MGIDRQPVGSVIVRSGSSMLAWSPAGRVGAVETAEEGADAGDGPPSVEDEGPEDPQATDAIATAKRAATPSDRRGRVIASHLDWSRSPQHWQGCPARETETLA